MLGIYTNYPAAGAASQLRSHYTNLSESVKRLSTGLRINSADDDAAGLAIRELMRSDISSIFQGVRNAQDAISLLQVADGSLGIIDKKLIRMKELAEQAATGTYDSTQRLMINSEFQAMANEIDRIANATDFNGIKLLNGSLSGPHNGSDLTSKGQLKIHFGTQNDSAEDYYYINIGDCTTKGLGLREPGPATEVKVTGELSYESVIPYPPYSDLNNYQTYERASHGREPFTVTTLKEGVWYCGIRNEDNQGSQNTMLLIPKGTTNFVLNEIGTTYLQKADNDIQLFTRDGKHLAGRSPIPDYGALGALPNQPTDLASNCAYMGFTIDQYDASNFNNGAKDQNDGATMKFTTYNGMNIGYSGDGPELYDNVARYEVLAIDKATEDLVVWLPGVAGAVFKYYTSDAIWPASEDLQGEMLPGNGPIISIDTQEKAQKALTRIDAAIVNKDKARSKLGALQNRFENTISCLNIQGENLMAAQSRIADADVALEMLNFVRNQILTQSATAMLSQANSSAQMIAQLIRA